MVNKKPTADEIKAFAEQVKTRNHSLIGDVKQAESAKIPGTHFDRSGAFSVASPLHGLEAKLNAPGADLAALGSELHGHVETTAKHLGDFGDEVSRAHAAASSKLTLAKKAGHLTEEQVTAHRELLDTQLSKLSENRKKATAALEGASKLIHDTTKVAPNMATSSYITAAARDMEKFAYAADRGWLGRRSDDVARTFKSTNGGLRKFGRVAGTGAGVLLIYDGTKRMLRAVNLIAPKIDEEGKAASASFGGAIGGLVEDAAGIAAVYYSLVSKGRGINLGRT